MQFHNQLATYESVVEQTAGKRFLSFDDAVFSEGLQQFLQERFPESCRYEF